jgi:hypothetical protein
VVLATARAGRPVPLGEVPVTDDSFHA